MLPAVVYKLSTLALAGWYKHTYLDKILHNNSSRHGSWQAKWNNDNLLFAYA